MSHMVDRMMYSGEVPWHGLGDYQSTIDFEDAKNVLCHVVERPIAYADTNLLNQPMFTGIDGYKAIVREDNMQALCVQKDSYGVAQYIDQLDVLNAAAGDGLLNLKTVGLLDEGRRAFAIADIPSAEFEVAGAPIKPYLMWSSSHDSTRLCRYLFTGVYVVCNNTETAALSMAGVGGNKYNYVPNVIQIRHTSRINDRLDTAKTLIAQAREYFGKFNEVALVLVNGRFTLQDVHGLVEDLFPASPKQQHDFERYGVQSAPYKARHTISYLFDYGRIPPQARGTKWAAYNAVTEYIDHNTRHRGKTPRDIAEARFEHSLFDTGAALRQKALTYLLAA